MTRWGAGRNTGSSGADFQYGCAGVRITHCTLCPCRGCLTDIFMKAGGELCGADIRGGGGSGSLPATAPKAVPGRRSGCGRGQRARGQQRGGWVCPPALATSNGHPGGSCHHHHFPMAHRGCVSELRFPPLTASGEEQLTLVGQEAEDRRGSCAHAWGAPREHQSPRFLWARPRSERFSRNNSLHRHDNMLRWGREPSLLGQRGNRGTERTTDFRKVTREPSGRAGT